MQNIIELKIKLKWASFDIFINASSFHTCQFIISYEFPLSATKLVELTQTNINLQPKKYILSNTI
jgi:hypothetical protein